MQTASIAYNIDQNPSEIFGSIEANGTVFLSNPNGLIFGDTATINAGSFVASGFDISSDDFTAGNYTLARVFSIVFDEGKSSVL